jgi:hypothetical protein
MEMILIQKLPSSWKNSGQSNFIDNSWFFQERDK